MSEISIKEEFLANGSRLMDINVPDKTLVAMVKRKGRFFIPRGNTELLVGDRILVITDDEKALEETYQSMKGKAQGSKAKITSNQNKSIQNKMKKSGIKILHQF